MKIWELSSIDEAVIAEEIKRRGLWQTLLWIWSPRGWTYRTDRVRAMLQETERKTKLLKLLASLR